VTALSPSAEAIAERLAELVAERVVEDAARRVMELLREQDHLAVGQLVDAATVARELGVSRDTVYAHANELGAIRLGDGPRSRMRFDLARARDGWAACSTGRRSERPEPRIVKPKPRRSPNGGAGRNRQLLPVRGENA